MPSLTDNHGLQIWAAGELDWQHRDDMQHIERTLTIRDFDSNLANYTAYDGARFEATDTGAVYLGDGSTWNEFVAKATQDHLNDTTNPHSVTSDQVGSPSDAEFTSHTSDTTNPHSVTAAQANALATAGGTMSGNIDLNAANGIDNAYLYDLAARDGSGDLWRLTTPDAATAQLLTHYAAGGGSTDIYRTRQSGDFELVNGDLIAESGSIKAPTGALEADKIRHPQRGAVTTSELLDGQRMTYVSDGTDSHAAGDLVSARNNAGTIVTQVIAAAADDA